MVTISELAAGAGLLLGCLTGLAAIAQALPPTARPALQIAALRAEAAWLAAAEPERIDEAARSAAAAGPNVTRWFAGEVEVWRHRAGLDCGDPAQPGDQDRMSCAFRAFNA